MFAWETDTKNKIVEFENSLSGNTYSTRPRFCYNTTTKFSPDGPVVGDRACDALLWFGNQLNVTDGVTTNNNMANMEVYVDGLYQKTLITPDTSRLNLFPYPEIFTGQKGMKIVGSKIMIFYNVHDLANTRLDLLIFDSNGSTVFRQNNLGRGGNTFIYVDAQYSGLSARFQMQTTDSLPTVRKSTVFRLP